MSRHSFVVHEKSQKRRSRWQHLLLSVLQATVLCLVITGTTLAQSEARSKTDAIAIAQQQRGVDARVLSVKEVREDNTTTYIVKLLSGGRVTIHRIPAQSN